jgi:hypothetical protein
MCVMTKLVVHARDSGQSRVRELKEPATIDPGGPSPGKEQRHQFAGAAPISPPYFPPYTTDHSRIVERLQHTNFPT